MNKRMKLLYNEVIIRITISDKTLSITRIQYINDLRIYIYSCIKVQFCSLHQLGLILIYDDSCMMIDFPQLQLYLFINKESREMSESIGDFIKCDSYFTSMSLLWLVNQLAMQLASYINKTQSSHKVNTPITAQYQIQCNLECLHLPCTISCNYISSSSPGFQLHIAIASYSMSSTKQYIYSYTNVTRSSTVYGFKSCIQLSYSYDIQLTTSYQLLHVGQDKRETLIKESQLY